MRRALLVSVLLASGCWLGDRFHGAAMVRSDLSVAAPADMLTPPDPADLGGPDLELPAVVDMTKVVDLAQPRDLATPLDMSEPCVDGTVRCNPTNHNYQEQCTGTHWVEQQCLVKSAPPVVACTEAKNSCIDTGWVQWSYKTTVDDRFTTIADPSGMGQTIIKDKQTGLYWQLVESSSTYTFTAAGLYCGDLSYGGYSGDWRLPSPTELTSIVDFAAPPPRVQAPFTAQTPSVIHWTSTSKYNDNTQAWTLDFAMGSPFVRPLIDPATSGPAVFRVRCVR